MRLNRPLALIVAALTLAPWAYFAFFFMLAVAEQPDPFVDQLDTTLWLHLFVMVLEGALLAFYLIHLLRADRIPADKKALWAVVLLFANLLAMPFYWYFYMWPKADGVNPHSRKASGL